MIIPLMETKRVVNVGLEEEMFVSYPVLDKGYIKLVEYMGTDETVVAAARHSYDKGVNHEDHVGNTRLIDFLMKNRHTSPFEQPALVFEVKAPIFVFREWHRHRVAKLNELSARYTVLSNEYYVPSPERIAYQSKSNKQGSSEPMSQEFSDYWTDSYRCAMNQVFEDYSCYTEEGMSKEVARVGLPVSTYSKMVWQCDLHNLMHFLKLRMAPAAQWEIRQYANAIGDIVAKGFPKTWKSFDNHVRRAKTLSGDEVEALRLRTEEGDLDYVVDLLKQKGIL